MSLIIVFASVLQVIYLSSGVYSIFKTPSVEMNLNQEQSPNNQAQPQANSNVGPAKQAPPKVKIMKPPKKNRKPPSSQNPPENESGTTECSTETQGEAT